MKTPFDRTGINGFAGDTEGVAHCAISRTFMLASVLLITALVPFVLAVSQSSSLQAEPTRAMPAPSATMLTWVAKNDAEKQSFQIERFILSLSTHIHRNGERVAFLSVRSPTGETASIHGQAGYPVPSAGFGVGRLDPKSSTPQVIFTSYTGGLHCCTKITVLTLLEGKWQRIEFGLWDGDPLPVFPSDVDGDGTPDLVLKDDRFDYAFAPYTESHKPPRIFNISGGRIVEVGQARRYDHLYQAHMKRTHALCLKKKNGACAAFVANAARLGRREWAWNIMLTHHQRDSDWGFPIKCKVPKIRDACPPGQSEQFRDFPEALAWFLTDTGYNTPQDPGVNTN
jgi:hypothetical protein